ncbi:hypothetical protein [Granulicella aggregans]|jgi:hypothetical protein|uniref:hypothetical protein n=1 Tax=Granulicella aggregans TaxID=474949 RepID=UPI0021DFE55C|nr:hypothetical protein [Granulicella aggregans]
MSTHESSVPKPHQSGSWNVIRSKSVPSGVSGSHSVAKPDALKATDESVLNKEEQAASNTRKQLRVFPSLDPALLKH